MKHLILRIMVAVLTFGLGFCVDRILISRNKEAPAKETVEVQLATTNPFQATPVTIAQSLPSPSPTPNEVFDFEVRKFNPSGVYYILGSVPKEFQEFVYLEIWADEIEGNLSGGVYFQNHVGDTYGSQVTTFSLVTPRRLVFVSSPTSEDGPVYRFDGEFLHRNPASVTNNKNAVLRGTLTKSIKGRKIAERVVSFWIDTEDHC